MRKPIVAGNWKMNKTVAEATDLVKALIESLGSESEVDVAVCPPYTALQSVGEQIKDQKIALGAQNMHMEASGAYTGEVAHDMLQELGCRYVILGHSERRSYFHEDDKIVNAKTQAALAAGLTPIVCVGETLEDREAGKTEDVVGTQVRGSLAGLDGDALSSLVIAYEPVWAIGTGKTATTEQAQEVHAYIRSVLTELADSSVAESVRIQYGGSVKPGNAAELFAQPDIDGGLIGGAALDADSFTAIVQAAK